MKLEDEFTKNMQIRNAHRLQSPDTPTPNIVAFGIWTERETFLRAGINLRGTKITIRIDLPPELDKQGGVGEQGLSNIPERSSADQDAGKNYDIWIESRVLTNVEILP